MGSVISTTQYQARNMQQVIGDIHLNEASSAVFGNVNHYYSTPLFGALKAVTLDKTTDAAVQYRKSRVTVEVSGQSCSSVDY